MELSAACRIGCVRHDNEDMILAGYQFIRDDEYRTQLELGERDRYMMAVADGMGGHLSGEVASSDVLHNLQFFFSDLPVGLNASSFNEMIVGWLESINMILDSKGKADEQYKGMGTPLVALAYYDGDFYSMNCGDSRLYRLRNEELVQLTTDHSLSSLMGDQKHSSVITNCIGGGCTNSFIDVVHIVDIQDGDTYLLCSDGLTDMMSDNRLSILLAEGADANDLCNAAIVRGGFDNVSACLIKVKKE